MTLSSQPIASFWQFRNRSLLVNSWGATNDGAVGAAVIRDIKASTREPLHTVVIALDEMLEKLESMPPDWTGMTHVMSFPRKRFA
jgi:hypothetical protein